MNRATLTWLAALGLSSCVTLLGLEDRPSRSFEHRAHAVEGVSCPDCHAGVSEAGEEGALHLPDQARCLSCHKTPHDPGPCRSCHGDPAAEQRAAESRRHLRFSHATHVPELKGNCARCHDEIADQNQRLLPTMGTCLSCHEHQDQFRVAACERCHWDVAAEGVRPESHLIHGTDFRQRHGAVAGSRRELCASCHGERFCADCHGVSTPPLSQARAFARSDALRLHGAGFRARHAEEARALPGTCVSCHRRESCQSCHTRSGVGATGALRRGPHPPGWVSATGDNPHGRAARLDPVSCASCHSGAGEALCVSCHRVGGIGGSPHPPGWTSQRRESESPCRACHLGGAP